MITQTPEATTRTLRRISAAAVISLTALLAASCSPGPSTTPEGPQALQPGVDAPGRSVDLAAGALRWAPPQLTSPEVVKVTNSNHKLKLGAGRDYIVEMPSTPIDVDEGLSIVGGRNVIVVGGQIHHSKWWKTSPHSNRGLFLKNQTGTVHVEGLWITGLLTEGINLSQTEGAAVQIQNLRVEKVVGSKATNHADIIQTWAGPRVLRVHNLTGVTTYQGIFLRPNDTSAGYPVATQDVTMSRIQIIQTGSDAAYGFWKGIDSGINYPVNATDSWVTNPRSQDRTQMFWPKNDPVWNNVKFGTPPGGDFVKVGAVGIGYTTPGA